MIRILLVTLPLLMMDLSLKASSDSSLIIQHYHDIWDAFADIDFDPWYGRLHKDAIIHTAQDQKLHGPQDIRNYYDEAKAGLTMVLLDWQITSLTVWQDIAFGTATYSASFTPHGKDPVEAVDIGWDFVWKKDNGDWSIFREFYYPSTPSDQHQIKQVVNRETQAFYDRDFTTWKKCFAHSPDLVWTVTNSNKPGDVITIRGWSSFQDKVKGWMKNPPSRKPSNLNSSRDRWNIQVRGDVAFISFSDLHYDKSSGGHIEVTDTRVLEKLDGQWRIIQLSSLFDFADAISASQSKN